MLIVKNKYLLLVYIYKKGYKNKINIVTNSIYIQIKKTDLELKYSYYSNKREDDIMRILWGDIHNHCGITYGFGSLENALKAAKSQLDFCAIIGHAMWPDMYEKNEDTKFVVNFHLEGFKKLKDHWEYIRQTIADTNSDEFVLFQGYEIHSCHYGDYHIISKEDKLPLIYRNSPRELVEDCGCEAIAIPHHIGYTPTYRGINWDEFNNTISPVVEVYSKHGCAMSESAPFPYYHNMGPRDTRNTVYKGIQQGKRFGFVGSTDHHAGFPGSYGDGMVAVLVEEKTRNSIFDALKARRTYAVTGDKIECLFTVNNAFMGSEIKAGERNIKYNVITDYWLDKIIVYKNLKPLHILNGEMCQELCSEGKYKIRVEMGWGNSDDLFTWNGNIRIENGKIKKYTTYFRGRNVLAPSEDADYDINSINAIDNSINRISDREIEWTCQTVKNKTTLSSMTDHIVFEIQGNLETKVTININGKEEIHTIRELLDAGYSNHIKPYHSHAFKVHQAIPETQYTFNLELKDTVKENECDVYHIEVAQKNGNYVFVSPIFVL